MSKFASFVLLIVVLCLIAVIAQSVPSSEEPRQPDIHQVFTFTSPQKNDKKKVNDKRSSTSTGYITTTVLCPEGHCDCIAKGNCVRCSRDEMQLPECLETMYKRSFYCPSLQKDKYYSCFPIEEAQKLWIFEVTMAMVGLAAYSVIWYRRRKHEAAAARRIHMQINA